MLHTVHIQTHSTYCQLSVPSVQGTSVEGYVNKHFEGTTINYIACLNVDYKSEREEAFQVLLSVFDFYTSPVPSASDPAHPRHCPTPPCADVSRLIRAQVCVHRQAGMRYTGLHCWPWGWAEIDQSNHHSRAALRIAKQCEDMLACGQAHVKRMHGTTLRAQNLTHTR